MIFFPFGLVALAALAGYQVEMLRNVRDGLAVPLPRWENFGQKINQGVGVLIAGALYNLPNIAWLCLSFSGAFSDWGGVLGAGLCCLTPALLLVNLLIIPLQAVGMIRFAESGRVESFFRFGDLFDVIRAHASLVLVWAVWMLLANFVIWGIGSVIPCLGWLAIGALATPVQAHLLGQLAAQLGYHKPKNVC
ncbi:MAG: DUF4013 domain-containing protein [Chloroflexi bacterium]|nr:DUF4013 domain-containing protein [Chloroflexota bacterium]